MRHPPGDLNVGNLFSIFPAFVPLREAAVVVVPEPERLNIFYRRFTTTIALLAILSVVAGWMLARLAARQTLRPLLLVTAELRRFESGDFTTRSTMKTDLTELGELAAAFNGAAAQVTAALIERRRVEEQIRQFVAEAGYELRTPLRVVAGYVDVLRRGGDGDPQLRAMSFESLRFELKRMRALVERLMTLAWLTVRPKRTKKSSTSARWSVRRSTPFPSRAMSRFVIATATAVSCAASRATCTKRRRIFWKRDQIWRGFGDRRRARTQRAECRGPRVRRRPRHRTGTSCTDLRAFLPRDRTQ